MDYLDTIIKDFKDLSIFPAWGILSRRMNTDTPRTLLHPTKMPKQLISELIPQRFNVNEILSLLPAKQKEIAKRLDISKLPRDRPPGLLGQAALFEVLRDKGFDFKSYLNDFYHNWDYGGPKANALIFLLGYIYYLRLFFGSPKLDLVKEFLGLHQLHQLALRWDENWVTRIFMNSTRYIPNNLTNPQIYEIVKRLVELQDSRGMTISRAVEWTGASRSEASHFLDIIRASWVEHRYRIVSKNTGTVKIITKSKSSNNVVPSFQSSCTSLKSNEDYFISMSDVFKADADGKYLEMESWSTNLNLFDQQDNKWKLSSTKYSARNVEDIFAILKTGDHNLPENKIPPTKRDIVFIALLTGMETSHFSKKRQEILRWFTKGYGIPKDEADKGIRNVLRKHMVRDQYTHYGIAGNDRRFFCILFDDNNSRTIPFLGQVLPNIMWAWLQTNNEMSYGLIFASHPTYMSSDLQNLIESSIQENSVNAETFLIHSWSYGQPGSILQLVADE